MVLTSDHTCYCRPSVFQQTWCNTSSTTPRILLASRVTLNCGYFLAASSVSVYQLVRLKFVGPGSYTYAVQYSSNTLIWTQQNTYNLYPFIFVKTWTGGPNIPGYMDPQSRDPTILKGCFMGYLGCSHSRSHDDANQQCKHRFLHYSQSLIFHLSLLMILQLLSWASCPMMVHDFDQ